MGAKKKAVAPFIDHEANIDKERLAADHQAAGDLGTHLVKIDHRFGQNGVPYHRASVEHEATFFKSYIGGAMFELGKRLLLLQEHEPHGEFLKCLDRIDIHVHTAYRLIKITKKFAGLKTLSALPQSKLLELAILEDDDLASLEQGETVNGLSYDKVDKMNVRELRATVRKLEAEAEATEKLVLDKDKKLNELAKKSFEPWDERMAGLTDELHTCSLGASECLARVLTVAQAAAVWKIDHDDQMHQKEELAIRIINDVNLLVQRVAAIQGFVYDHFMQYVEGGTPVLTDPVEPARGKKRGAD